MFEVYAKEETENEGSGIDLDPDLRSPRLPYDPLVADQLSSSGSTSARKKSLLKFIIATSFTNPLQEAMDKLNSFNEKYGLGSLSSTHSGPSEEDFQINTVDRS